MASSRDVGCRRVLDPAWLWPRPTNAVPIRPLAQELPYASGAALKKKKERKKLGKLSMRLDTRIRKKNLYLVLLEQIFGL